MPMNAVTLKTAIQARMLALFAAMKASEYTDADFADEMSGIIAEEVIGHIQANATITTSVSVTSVSGVTTGPSISGPGVGTGTGTIA